MLKSTGIVLIERIEGGVNMSGLQLAYENDKNPITQKDLQRLLELLDSIKHGSVTLIIQEGRVVQIEKNEKVRLK